MFNTRPKKRGAPSARQPDQKREYDNARGRRLSAERREIGTLPPVADPERRESTRLNLRRYAEVYYQKLFYLPWSEPQLKAIAKLEHAALHGGLFAYAMSRGGGKTALVRVAISWALMHGHRRFVAGICATQKDAGQLLANLKTEWRTNDLLAADFPEICVPIRALEDDARRANGQLCQGAKTFITWGKSKVVLPTIEGSVSSGSVVTVSGLTGAIRGQNHILPTGEQIRPELAVVDDPQTKNSAFSEGQCKKRVEILMGDVLMLAGPNTKIAAFMPCTILRQGDMADEILDRKRHPEWQGERTPMLASFPTDMKLWDQYWSIRRESLDRDADGSEATEFYRHNREKMDAGAGATWPARFNSDEISAVQHAMNLYFRDEEAFQAECQNAPKPKEIESAMLLPGEIAAKLNGREKGSVPQECQKLTGFIDVQADLLYWMVCGWNSEEFTGYVLDYGAWPEQPRRYFTLRQAVPTLTSTFPGLTREAALHRGLESLRQFLQSREFVRDDGTVMQLDRILVDQGYLPDVVHGWIRASGHASLFMPSRGVGIGAAGRPMSEDRKKPGETIAFNWKIPAVEGRTLRHVRYDTNFWKSFVHARLALPIATKGGMSLYGSKATEHRMLSEHLTAEYGIPTEGNGRQLVEWRPRPGKPDNHLFDCIVGCAVAANMVGTGKSLNPVVTKRRRPSYRKPIYQDDRQDFALPVAF